MLPRQFIATSSDWVAPPTVPNLLGVLSLPASSVDCLLALDCLFTWFGLESPTVDFFGLSLLDFALRHLIRRTLVPVGSNCPGILMQTNPSQDDEVIELSFRFRHLDITVRGPAREASGFLSAVTTGSFAGPAPSLSSSRSFELVSSVSSPERAPRSVPETRDQILSSFPRCPGRLLVLASRLGGGSTSGEERLRRAWTCGLWAKAVLDGRCHSPNRSPALDIRSRFYAVVKCEGIHVPVIYRSSASYWSAIRSLAESDSISHSFPSELEAKVYIEAVGFDGEVSILP